MEQTTISWARGLCKTECRLALGEPAQPIGSEWARLAGLLGRERKRRERTSAPAERQRQRQRRREGKLISPSEGPQRIGAHASTSSRPVGLVCQLPMLADSARWSWRRRQRRRRRVESIGQRGLQDKQWRVNSQGASSAWGRQRARSCSKRRRRRWRRRQLQQLANSRPAR